MDISEFVLHDILTNEDFKVYLSKDDAIKAQTDVVFANTLLNNARAQQINIQDENMDVTKDGSVVTFPTSVEDSDEERIDDVQPIESSQVVNDTGDDLSIKSSFRWSHKAILLLLDEHRKMEPKLNAGKITYKRAWEDIAEIMINKGHPVTSKQFATRLNTMKRTYKSIKDHNNKSGNSPRKWRYFEIMDNLFKERPYMAPMITISSTGNETCNISNVSTPAANSTLVSRKRRVDNVDLLINEIKSSESKRSKRHEERLEIQKTLINTLNNLIKKV